LHAGYHDSSRLGPFARDWGLDKHFLAVAEDEESYKFLEERWPGQGVRLHVPQIEGMADSAEMKRAGVDSAIGGRGSPLRMSSTRPSLNLSCEYFMFLFMFMFMFLIANKVLVLFRSEVKVEPIGSFQL